MQLHQLRYVLAVAEHESFSKAAEALFLSQPSLSVQVSKLENELGVELFERLARRVVLTSAGEAFLAHVRPALEQLDQAAVCAQDEQALRGGRVAVGALPSIAARILPGCVAEFRRRHPGVDIRLLEHSQSAELERRVAVGDLDLAIVRQPRIREELAERLLVREPFVALMPSAHPLARAKAVDCRDLREERFVAMEPDSGLRLLFDRLCRRAGFEPDIAVETTQLATMWGMVESGVGVTLVPRLASGASAPPSGLSVVPLNDDFVRTLLAVWRPRGLAAAATRFLDHLVTTSQVLSDNSADQAR
jgi:LysR family hydrogen peroxide-inducible transcriptional activator